MTNIHHVQLGLNSRLIDVTFIIYVSTHDTTLNYAGDWSMQDVHQLSLQIIQDVVHSNVLSYSVLGFLELFLVSNQLWWQLERLKYMLMIKIITQTTQV
jgi:hypothetical protein